MLGLYDNTLYGFYSNSELEQYFTFELTRHRRPVQQLLAYFLCVCTVIITELTIANTKNRSKIKGLFFVS